MGGYTYTYFQDEELVSYLGYLHPRKLSSGSLASISSLCATLDITQTELNDVLAMSAEERYSSLTVPKAGGKERLVFNPHRLLRRIQRRINNRILGSSDIVEWPIFLYGSITNQDYELSEDETHLNKKDYISCAARHCGARSILKLDIQSFFDNLG